jgi:hypothetical protein
MLFGTRFLIGKLPDFVRKNCYQKFQSFDEQRIALFFPADLLQQGDTPIKQFLFVFLGNTICIDRSLHSVS